MCTSLFRFAGLLVAGALAASSADLDDSYQALKDAVSKKDIAQVKQLASETCALARAASSSPAPAEAAEKDAWTKRVAYARDVELYTEYALSSTALTSQPEITIDLLTALEQQSPKSRYLDAAYGAYLVALTKTGAASKVPAVAEKALAHFPENEDLLLVMIDFNMNRKRAALAGAQAERLLTVIRRHPVPEGMSAADWERKKTVALTRGSWVAGMAHAEKNEYMSCDKDLRVALPLVKGDSAMLASTLFHLAVSNYNLGRQSMNRARILEAANFSEQASKIPGPYQQQAWTNAHLMKSEADRMIARK